MGNTMSKSAVTAAMVRRLRSELTRAAALLGVVLVCDTSVAAVTVEPCNQSHECIDDGGLFASRPHTSMGEHLRLYGQFVGDWDVVATTYTENGTARVRHGEWNFRWILEGRAVQDMFIVPARGARGGSTSGEKQSYGTTLRMYDPQRDSWEIIYVDPAYAAVFRLTARFVDGEIMQSGVDSDGRAYRWVFFDIEPDSFRWRAEVLQTDGKTWRKEQEFVATRKTASQRY
jgi:hypothetical protein